MRQAAETIRALGAMSGTSLDGVDAAVLLTDGAKMIKTPTYHAFELYIPFQDATYLPLELDDVPAYEVGDVSVPHISATGALTTDGAMSIEGTPPPGREAQGAPS